MKLSTYQVKPKALLAYFLIALICLTSQAFAATAEKLTYQDYAALPDFDMFSVSPNGEMFAYRNTTSGKQVGIIYSRTENKMIRVFDIGDANVYDLYFLTDNFLIMMVSEYQRVPGDQKLREYKNALAYDIAKNKITQLLSLGDIVSEYQTNLGRIIGLSDDHKYVYMPAFIGGNLERPENGVVRVKLSSPKKPKIIYQGYFDSTDFLLDKNKDVIAHEIMFDRNDKYEIRAKLGKKWKTLYEEDAEWSPYNVVGLTPNEQSLILLQRSTANTLETYSEMSLKDGSITKLKLSRDDVGFDFVFLDSSRNVLGLAYSGFFRDYYFFDDELNDRVQSILKIFDGNNVFISDISDNLKHIVVRVEGSGYVGDYFIFSEGQKGQFIASTRSKFRPEHVHPISKLTIKARDGRSIPTLMVIPNNKVSNFKNLPAIVLPHGGPASYDNISFNWTAQALANEGYLVIQPQFRGSTGFGTEHWAAGFGELGAKSQDDITDALQALVSKGYVDKNRVCIMGYGYGGYAALAGGMVTPDLYQCVVAVNAPTDLGRIMNRGLKNTSYKAYWRHQYTGGKEVDSDFWKERSPSKNADKFKAPVMLAHAKRDSFVRIEHSQLMNKALKGKGKSVEFITLNGDNHYLKDEESRMTLLKNAVGFINKHIGSSAK